MSPNVFTVLTSSLLTQMKASEKGYYDIAEALVKNGADIELHSNDGCCALSENYAVLFYIVRLSL
jgi:hypothetical protein